MRRATARRGSQLEAIAAEIARRGSVALTDGRRSRAECRARVVAAARARRRGRSKSTSRMDDPPALAFDAGQWVSVPFGTEDRPRVLDRVDAPIVAPSSRSAPTSRPADRVAWFRAPRPRRRRWRSRGRSAASCFDRDDPRRPLFVAEEIGIVPIRSILADLDETGLRGRPATLVYWGRDPRAGSSTTTSFRELARRAPALRAIIRWWRRAGGWSGRGERSSGRRRAPDVNGGSRRLRGRRRGHDQRRARDADGAGPGSQVDQVGEVLVRGMAELTGGELVARVLKQAGVGHVFTLCGGHILPIYDGCLTEGIRVIDVRHEQAAAHARRRVRAAHAQRRRRAGHRRPRRDGRRDGRRQRATRRAARCC